MWLPTAHMKPGHPQASFSVASILRLVLRSGAEGEGAAIHLAADNDVTLVVFLHDHIQRHHRLENESIGARLGDVIYELRPIAVLARPAPSNLMRLTLADQAL